MVSRVNDADIKTGELIIHSLSDVWECTDVTIEDKNYSLVLVVKNQKGQTSLIPCEDLGLQEKGTYRVYEKSLYDKYVTRFGIVNMNKIRQQKIAVGMTPEMLKLSWGEPDYVNKSSRGPNQWVYGRQYVYLQNGKVTSWN